MPRAQNTLSALRSSHWFLGSPVPSSHFFSFYTQTFPHLLTLSSHPAALHGCFLGSLKRALGRAAVVGGFGGHSGSVLSRFCACLVLALFLGLREYSVSPFGIVLTNHALGSDGIGFS